MATLDQSSRKLVLIATALCLSFLLFPGRQALAQSGKAGDSGLLAKFKFVFNGFTIGEDTRLFPYASLADWFEPYVGLKLGHRSPLNSTDRMLHHFKFEGYRDYSWKFRYMAHSISSTRTKLSFLFKRKTDRDPYFYGIGNSTTKSGRISAKYASIFLGGEVKHAVSDGLVFRWSPGFWKFRSGLLEGGEFEPANHAQYFSSRFSLSDSKSVDYWQATLDNQWSAFVEIALPVNSPVASYVRFNAQTRTQLPTFKSLKLTVGTRFEYLVSSDKSNVPYFAIPEAGSKSDLRGFSKERFRNYALAVYNIEIAFPISASFDAFVLSDLAQTADDPTGILGNHIHAGFGAGLRLLDTKHPFSVGIAASRDSAKLFSSVAIGSPW